MSDNNENPVTEVTAATNYDDTIHALTTQVTSGSIMTWSDAKKKDFVDLYRKRANVSIYILRNTAHQLAQLAREKKFLGSQRYEKLREDCSNFSGDDVPVTRHQWECNNNEYWQKTYDRSQTDLNNIVQERAQAMFKQLPSLNKAILILDPETAQKMEQRDLLREDAQRLVDALEETNEPIKMSECDQNMTIGQFRAWIKSLDEKRAAQLKELKEITDKGQELEKQINKALYKGVPGISEEIESVCKDLYEKSKAFSVLTRRIEENVLYGDSEQAMNLLSHFEKDESTMRSDIAARFQAGLEKLKLRVSKKKKAAAATEALPAIEASTEPKPTE